MEFYILINTCVVTKLMNIIKYSNNYKYFNTIQHSVCELIRIFIVYNVALYQLLEEIDLNVAISIVLVLLCSSLLQYQCLLSTVLSNRVLNIKLMLNVK